MDFTKMIKQSTFKSAVVNHIKLGFFIINCSINVNDLQSFNFKVTDKELFDKILSNAPAIGASKSQTGNHEEFVASRAEIILRN